MLLVAFVDPLKVEFIVSAVIILLSCESQEVFSSFTVFSVSLKTFTPFHLVMINFAHDMSQMVSFLGVSFVAFLCAGTQAGIGVTLICVSWSVIECVSFGQDSLPS